jgi:hypothetical protein
VERREPPLAHRDLPPLPEEDLKALRRAFGFGRPGDIPRPPTGSDEISEEMRRLLGLKPNPWTSAPKFPPGGRHIEPQSDEQAGARPYLRKMVQDAIATDNAHALGIRTERFRVSPGPARNIDYDALRIGDAYYQVNLSTMRQMQHAVAEGFASGVGFIVQRLQPTDGSDDARSAFLLYTGGSPPLEFVGGEGLEPLAAMASFAYL